MSEHTDLREMAREGDLYVPRWRLLNLLADHDRHCAEEGRLQTKVARMNAARRRRLAKERAQKRVLR